MSARLSTPGDIRGLRLVAKARAEAEVDNPS